ncbi:hypothetical protein PCCS19_16970 [Paenibacillus sp. CCS19]|nr:hypothetical protein PCCS19_16970 [Paenibacillus cellulosilyticus]
MQMQAPHRPSQQYGPLNKVIVQTRSFRLLSRFPNGCRSPHYPEWNKPNTTFSSSEPEPEAARCCADCVNEWAAGG